MFAKSLVRVIHRATLTLVLSLLAGVRPGIAAADLGSTIAFDIPAQDLPSALLAYSQQSGVQVTSAGELIEGKSTSGVIGTFIASGALDRLLSETELAYKVIDTHTVAIRQKPSSSSTVQPGDVPRETLPRAPKPGFWERLRLSRVESSDAAAEAPASTSDTASEPAPSSAVEEVVVTAQKRIERLQDVPVPVTVINTGSLVSNNQLLLRDYYAKVPGLNLTPTTQSGQVPSLRGVTTGGGNPTVGISVDEVPFGSATFLGGSNVVPDIDPNDLARIEVLRGPQGTLYGASSLGGLIKFVTIDPSMDSAAGRVQVGLSSVRNGDAAGYNVRGSVNVPLNDTWAIRASGFTRSDPGYVDAPAFLQDPGHREDGINRADAEGGRLAALWRPSETFSLKLNALLQEIRGDGSSDVQPAIGDLQQSYLRGTGEYDRKVQAYGAVLQARLGTVDLISVSGYNINTFSDSFDGTSFRGATTQAIFGVDGARFANENKTKRFSQEVRFSAPIGPHAEGLLGAFYTDEDSLLHQRWLAVDPTTSATVGRVYLAALPTTFEEYAGFGDLTYHFNDRFDVQVGARTSRIRQTYDLILDLLGKVTQGPQDARTNSFTYLLTPRLKLSPDLMVYARLASGYRAGGTNVAFPEDGIPSAYDPDKSRNYELGLKGTFLDRKVSVDASLYYIDWQNIQLTLFSPVAGTTYVDNVGQAKSQGVELSVELRPLDGLSLSAWTAWNDAELTEDFPGRAGTARAGDRLPFSSRFSGNVSLEQEFPFVAGLTGLVGGSVSYVGERRTFIGSTGQHLAAYARTDLHAGVKRDSWRGDLYVNNVADRRGQLNTGVAPLSLIYIQPRTVGLSVSREF